MKSQHLVENRLKSIVTNALLIGLVILVTSKADLLEDFRFFDNTPKILFVFTSMFSPAVRFAERITALGIVASRSGPKN